MKIFVAALLVASFLAGCLSNGTDDSPDGRSILDPKLRAPLSEATFAIGPHLDHTFTGTTSTQLYVDYVMPEGDGPFPVILVFTPYQSPDAAVPGGEGGPLAGDDPPYDQELVDYFVPRGYVVAFADVRGNHNAGGCVGQTDPPQWQDGYDYVEWLGTQPWSNGKVGMHGISYDGETQYTTAMMQPPHLVTIVPASSVSNQYDWSFYEGVPYELQPALGMVAYFAGSAAPSSRPEDAPLYPEKLECQGEMMQAGLDFSGDATPFWKERDYRPMAGQIKASVLNVHGLADWNVRPVHIDPLFNDVTSEKRAIYGQWRHQYPLRDDWETIRLAWYDYFLLGRDNGILDILPPVLIQDSEFGWHGMDSFPPRTQDWLSLELSADGRLVAPGEADEGMLVLHDYPSEVVVDPFGFTGLPGVYPTQTVGTLVTGHGTELDFTWTAPRDLRLVGRPTVSFTAESSAASTHWAARLWVEGDDCMLKDDGGQGVCTNAGFQDTRHRDGLDNPSDLEPGVAYNLTIRMYPQYDVIPAGAVVHVTLANNDPNIMQDLTNSENHVHVGGAMPAVVRFPLAPVEVDLPDKLPLVYPGYLE